MKKETIKAGKGFSLERVKSILPHRDPFLLIDGADEVIDAEPGQIKGRKIIATKQISGDEFYFKGHFPGNPVMPGVLMIETMAQVGAFGMYSEEAHGPDYTVLFLGCDNVRFRKMVKPPMTLLIEVDVISFQPSRAKFHGVVKDKETGELCCEADMIAAAPNARKR